MGDLQLPPGFRFHPTDEELVMHYLCRKCAGLQLAVPIIAEINLYKFNPWDLPGSALYGEKERYFFSPRDRKYPNGSRPNRAAGSGYWKATGADKPVGTPQPVAIKKALVFYAGKAPKGDKTNWIMHEYRLANVDRSARKKNSLRLDDWVLCRIYKKKGGGGERPSGGADKKLIGSKMMRPGPGIDQKPELVPHVQGTMMPPPARMSDDMFCFDTSDSLPKLHVESSCSEHVLSPEFSEREVESQLGWGELVRALGGPISITDAAVHSQPMFESGGPLSSSVFKDRLQDMDMFMHLQKSFEMNNTFSY